MNNRLHIVCLDAPSPPDYGGAIDMFYKIKALSQIGKEIYLHYFEYGNKRSIDAILPFTKKVFSYKRKSFISGPQLALPYIVSSRVSKALIDELNKDEASIILEGIHCTGVLPYLKNKDRKIIVRIHNDEALYYQRLGDAEKNLARKMYDRLESELLKRYQKTLPKKIVYACLSSTDAETFSHQYQQPNVIFLPCFVPWQKVTVDAGVTGYCLYHGNMAVSENEMAVLWLIQEVFLKINVPFYIAGKGISDKVIRICAGKNHIKLIPDPTIEAIDNLVKNAQINVLPSLNNTGVKLKLLHALFCGKWCITNKAGVEGSGLEQAVIIAEKGEEWIIKIQQLLSEEVAESQIMKRQQQLQIYNNTENAQKINELLP